MWKPIEFKREDGKRRMIFHLPFHHKRAADRLISERSAQLRAESPPKAPAQPSATSAPTPSSAPQPKPKASPAAAQGAAQTVPQAQNDAANAQSAHAMPVKAAQQPAKPKIPFWKRLSFKPERSKREEVPKQKREWQKREKRLETYLRKAGFETPVARIHKVCLWITILILALFTIVTYWYGIVHEANPKKLILFYLAAWLSLFWFIYLIVLLFVYVYLDLRMYKRTRELEDVLPDFLQLTSANISAGMPIDRALWFAIRPNFGVLAREIEEVARATLAGEELHQSLTNFTNRYDSLLLKRSVNILLEGIEAGGEIAELLDKIALNIQETKILRKEMAASVTTYAIFITFASIVMAPLLFGLGTELLTVVTKITESIDISDSTNTFMSFSFGASEELVAGFRGFSYVMLSITALMSALIVGTIKKGHVKDSIHNLPIFIIVSLTIYTLASWALGKLLGGII